MPTSVPPYPAEFRQQIVDLHRAGRTIGELSREFGVSKQSISNWTVQAAAERAKPALNKALDENGHFQDLGTTYIAGVRLSIRF